MRTYPILRSDGTIRGFEISNFCLSYRSLLKILSPVDGVSDVQRQRRSDDRVIFSYHGEKCVVNEPFGDNSRYWIGPMDPVASRLDINPLHRAFQQYRSPISRIFFRITNILKGQQINQGDGE
jgi:hypothetical protein